jgi:hypothetical protein
MKRGKLYIHRDKGMFLTDLAKKLGLHRNTVVNHMRRLHIRRGLMMGENRVRRQAILIVDIPKFTKAAADAGLISDQD